MQISSINRKTIAKYFYDVGPIFGVNFVSARLKLSVQENRTENKNSLSRTCSKTLFESNINTPKKWKRKKKKYQKMKFLLLHTLFVH